MRSLTSSDSDEQIPEAQKSYIYFRGVYPCGKRWKAQIHFEGAQHYLGTYETPEEAAKAYDQAAREHHGERGKTNYDKNGELSESIQRRRARPRPQHKRLSSSAKSSAVSPRRGSGAGFSYSMLGKRTLDFLPRPELRPLTSYSSSGYTHETDGNTMDSLSGSNSRTHSPEAEGLHSQITIISDMRNRVEFLLHHPAPPTDVPLEDLQDEYVVCTIRLDDLMRKMRRIEAQQTASSSSSTTQMTASTPSPRESPSSSVPKPSSIAPDSWHTTPSFGPSIIAPIPFPVRPATLPPTSGTKPHWA